MSHVLMLAMAVLGPMVLSWPETTQFCNGAPYDASKLLASYEVVVREYEPPKAACWVDLKAEFDARAGKACKPGEDLSEWNDAVWACWTESSKNVTSLQDFSFDGHEDLPQGRLSHTFQYEVGRSYMAIIRTSTYKHDLDLETGAVSNIDESSVTLDAWSFIVGKTIVAASDFTQPGTVRIRVEQAL